MRGFLWRAIVKVRIFARVLQNCICILQVFRVEAFQFRKISLSAQIPRACIADLCINVCAIAPNYALADADRWLFLRQLCYQKHRVGMGGLAVLVVS